MGELAAAAVQRAVEAVVDHDDAKAQAVIDGDDEIDELYLRDRQRHAVSCWPCSRRSRPTFGWCRRSCTAVCISSGSATKR